MIGIVFQFRGQIIEVRIDGTNCLFRTDKFGGRFFTIENLKLDKKGVIKEHPDLKDNDEWRTEAIKRFNEHLKKMGSEIERKDYVIEELSKCGYRPLYLQRTGFRQERIK